MDEGGNRGGFLDFCGPEMEMAAAELAAWGPGGGRGTTQEPDRKGAAEAAKRLAQAAIHLTAADGRPQQQAEGSRRCIFTEVLGCSGRHPPWKCGRFGNVRPKEREDNRGQQTLRFLPSPLQGKTVRSEGEAGQYSMQCSRMQRQAHQEAA
jgi:hypothetical protein